MVWLWLAAVGQTGFVAWWMTMPWWRTWVGRALMTKSAALCLVLWFWVAGFYFPDYPYRDLARDALLALVTFGIWFQFGALVAEDATARKADDDS